MLDRHQISADPRPHPTGPSPPGPPRPRPGSAARAPADTAPPSSTPLRLDVSPAGTEVLLALVAVHARDGRATVRAVAAAAERGVSATHVHLMRLRGLGLVAWDPPRQGTLRPLVAAVPWRRPSPRGATTGSGARGYPVVGPDDGH